jgi:hypothetical protein
MGRDTLSSGCVALDAFREPSTFISSFKGVLGLLNLDIKVKLTLEQPTKAQRGSRGIAYSFFNLGARWGGWSTPIPGLFTPGKDTRHPLYSGEDNGKPLLNSNSCLENPL